MSFFQRLDAAAVRHRSRLCVGLDPDPALFADLRARVIQAAQGLLDESAAGEDNSEDDETPEITEEAVDDVA